MMSPKVFQLGFSRSLMKIILICQMSICMCMTCCQRIHLGVVKGMRDETLERAKGEKYNKVIKIQSFPSLLLWEVRLQPGIAKCITFTEILSHFRIWIVFLLSSLPRLKFHFDSLELSWMFKLQSKTRSSCFYSMAIISFGFIFCNGNPFIENMNISPLVIMRMVLRILLPAQRLLFL